MLAITGYGSRIVQELLPMLDDEEVIRITGDKPVRAERYLLCAGVLRPKSLLEQSDDEVAEAWLVNFLEPARMCERVFETNPDARICIVGSESGFAWSHDGVYAASKAALHGYVKTKKLQPDQQLVCVAPSIIADAGMTLRRQDSLAERKRQHPKRRFLQAVEVARLIHFLLYRDRGYLTGTVIRMNGGAHT